MPRIGANYWGKKKKSLQYFGPKYFIDTTLMNSDPASLEPAGEPQLLLDDVRHAFEFSKPFGAAFHVQGREGLERILAVHAKRELRTPDVLDHCGRCGPFADAIAAQEFRVTILPRQLLDLPELHQIYGSSKAQDLLQFPELFRAGVEPALTSDWPYGMSNASSVELALAPLSGMAVVVSGKTPDGNIIPFSKGRTIDLSDAMLGHTRYGAQAIGRGHDLGQIAPGHFADFVLLDHSPFTPGTGGLYSRRVIATFVGGEQVYDATKTHFKMLIDAGDAGVVPGGPASLRGAGSPKAAGPASVQNFEMGFRKERQPYGLTPSPVIGYDPTLGPILGGALFFYAYTPRGLNGDVQTMMAPKQGRGQGAITLEYAKLTPHFTPQFFIDIDSFRNHYYGVGNTTPSEALFDTDPLRVEGKLGCRIHLFESVSLGTYGLYSFLDDRMASDILQQSGEAEGIVNGHGAGGRLEVTHDTRETNFSPRYGGKRTLWVEEWMWQGSDVRPRSRLGFEVAQFFPVLPPNVVLALRSEGGLSFGDRSYFTNYALGGIKRLRGYYSNRFRGDHYLLGGSELRFPIWSFISGVAFAEAGKVWAKDQDDGLKNIALAGGGGLRFGLPPDYRIKLRFDIAASKDQWGIFFAFNEAF